MTQFELLKAKLAEIADIKGALALLSWDQEVMMPAGGIASRARQSGTLSGLQHDMYVNQAGPLLDKVEAEEYAQMDEWHQQNVREIKREMQRVRKLPTSHVMEVTQAASHSQQVWAKSRAANDFEMFKPHLKQLVDLRIREAEYYGYTTCPYDALLDMYEPGMTTLEVKSVFESVKPGLLDILGKIKECPERDETFIRKTLPVDEQLKWGVHIANSLGYSADHGRQDVSAHPFSIAMSPEDVRITTKVAPDDIREMLYSTIHEVGHALYELGLNTANYGLPAGEACSMAIHESQSRLWENQVGRSLEFWDKFLPSLASTFQPAFNGYVPFDFFRVVNKVKPSLVRISADELTYHFHIIMRFELESAMINGELKVEDLPAAWAEKTRQYLGLEVPSHAQGCLQDIHWSFGSFGYFPTYSLGSFYAAQFMAKALQDVPGLQEQLKQGNFRPLLLWLREKIHVHGRTMVASELCKKVTGETLNVEHFLTYARTKFSKVYQIEL